MDAVRNGCRLNNTAVKGITMSAVPPGTTPPPPPTIVWTRTPAHPDSSLVIGSPNPNSRPPEEGATTKPTPSGPAGIVSKALDAYNAFQAWVTKNSILSGGIWAGAQAAWSKYGPGVMSNLQQFGQSFWNYVKSQLPPEDPPGGEPPIIPESAPGGLSAQLPDSAKQLAQNFARDMLATGLTSYQILGGTAAAFAAYQSIDTYA